jgi:hypothetical protein
MPEGLAVVAFDGTAAPDAIDLLNFAAVRIPMAYGVRSNNGFLAADRIQTQHLRSTPPKGLNVDVGAIWGATSRLHRSTRADHCGADASVARDVGSRRLSSRPGSPAICRV